MLLLVVNNLNPAKSYVGKEMRCNYCQSHPYSRIHNAVKLTNKSCQFSWVVILLDIKFVY